MNVLTNIGLPLEASRTKQTCGIGAVGIALSLAAVVMATDKPVMDLKPATKEEPWVNSLDMKFVPVKGTAVLFCIWHTRVQDFAAFVKATGYNATVGMYSLRASDWKTGMDTWESPGFRQGPTHPVCGVSWEDARSFCRWLTKKERDEGRLTAGQEYRLPTDAEWSAAVGLGTETGDTPEEKSEKIKGVYPWGAQWPPPKGAGNFAGEEAKEADWTVIKGYNDGYPRTSPVGSFAVNPFGLYDMGGNLCQWCEDLYSHSESSRVLRGGSWRSDDPVYLLSSRRLSGPPGLRTVNFGFRCVLVVSAGSK